MTTRFAPLSPRKSKGVYTLRAQDKPVSYSTVRNVVKEVVYKIGENPKLFCTHSFRAGGASAAANAGVPDRMFKRHGRWRSETCKDMYVKR